MTHLYDPLTLRGITIRNRIGVSPMCQYSSEDGFMNDWHLVHLGARAAGGAGLIITEATAVEARGRISPQDAGIWKDEHIAPLKRITDFLKSQGATPGIQLAHAGRKASTYRPWDDGITVKPEDGGWQVVGVTDEAFADTHPQPKILTIEEIGTIQQAFVDGAQRALAAGFDLLELHGAHGYLLHSFYSPLSNTRTDAYGGSFENRTRFLMETVQKVRAIMPDERVLAVRISASDWKAGGWTIEDSVKLAAMMKSAGVDIVDCSSGGVQAGIQYEVGANYQVQFSEKVRHGADIPTMAVGMITEPMQADAIIRTGQADIALLGREMLRQPYWALHAADAVHQSDKKALPAPYSRAF